MHSRTALVAVAGFGIVLGACSGGSKKATTTEPERNGVLRLLLAEVPTNVRCLELDVMVANAAQMTVLNRGFDVTPGQPASLSADGLPDGVWLNLAAKTYNVACGAVLYETAVTWFTPKATSVKLAPGVPQSIALTLRAMGTGSARTPASTHGSPSRKQISFTYCRAARLSGELSRRWAPRM